MGKKPVITDDCKDYPLVPVDSLEPLQGNLKDLSEREYNKLKRSLIERGIFLPFFVWREGNALLDGHQRQRVMIREGWLMDVPVHFISAPSLAEAKKDLLRITSQYGKTTQDGWDEFTADMGDWPQLNAQFDALPFVFDSLGEPEQEPEDAEPKISRADELREQWETELGQLWRLPSRTPGHEHRLICGDCTDAAVVEKVMGGNAIDLILTDPPYGINVVQKDTGTIGASKWADVNFYAPVEGDDRPYDPTYILGLDGNKIIFGGNYFASKLPDSRCWIVWDKNNTGNYFADAELAWTSFETSVRLYKHTWNGLVREGERRLEGKRRIHPTQKPVGLFMSILSDYSDAEDIVSDFYSGSGTTIIAAENLSRQCRAVEISPAYVAVALQRYVDAFGIEPELVRTL